MILAAMRPDLFGPIIIAGAPLSYWAGVRGKNPMRYSGGLLGGSWLAALTSDLGHGKFDGGWLVQKSGDDLTPGSDWTFTGHFHEWLLSKAIVGPQAISEAAISRVCCVSCAGSCHMVMACRSTTQ